MKYHWEADQSTDAEVADYLADLWKTKQEDGVRFTWDPVAGLWLTDSELVRNYRARRKGRRVFGDTSAEGTRNAEAMNRSGL